MAGGAGRVWPPLCGQERRCGSPALGARPSPRKGKFEKLVICRRQGNRGLERRPPRPPKHLAHLGSRRPVAMLRAYPGLAGATPIHDRPYILSPWEGPHAPPVRLLGLESLDC